MPPANSPSECPPSTPPGDPASETVASALNSNPYLRHIAEAISTPVPDLASTLNLSSSAPPPPNEARVNNEPSSLAGSQRSTRDRERWDRRSPAGENNSAESRTERGHEGPSSRRIPQTGLASQGWGRERLAAVMRSHRESLQRDLLRDAPLGSDAREGRRQTYATTGEGPARENLYDWAVSWGPTQPQQDSSSSDEGDLDMASTAGPNSDIGARRDLQRLERVLQNYRATRNTVRTGRSSDLGAVGAVPTAAALRAYWVEELNAGESAAGSSGTPNFGSQQRPELPRLDQQRLERRRRNAEFARLEADRERRAADTTPRSSTQKEPERSKAVQRVRNSIRYLSQLRHTDVAGGMELARELGLDSLYETEGSAVPSDLPMHVNRLPVPQYSSWLEPGMVWHGLQSTDKEPIRSSTAEWAAHSRADRQRDVLHRRLIRRREWVMGNFHQEAEGFSGSLRDAERYLSNLLTNNSRSNSPTISPPSPSPPTQPTPQLSECDHWPVKVTIHSVDWNSMTLTGTMSASHMPERLSALQQSISPTPVATTSMSSFFTGEIIDFRHQPLETEAEGRDYNVGGLDVDASYWQRLGPFREEIARVKSLQGKGRSEYQTTGPIWDAFRRAAARDGENKDASGFSAAPSHFTERDTDTQMAENGSQSSHDRPGLSPTAGEESRDVDEDEIMARSLGSARWMVEKLGNEWILMRWKERCFVTPTNQSSDSHEPRTIINSTMISATGAGAGQNGGSGPSWGLTISGFYYIALNRLTGEIDGLYYDPGSQPYQALRMVPEGMSLGESTNPGSHNTGDTRIASSGRTTQQCGCGGQNCKERVGLKKWFPSVEFR